MVLSLNSPQMGEHQTRFRVMDEHITALTDTPVTMARFSGSNPDRWILQAERYFTFYQIRDDDRVTISSFYFDAEAAYWFAWMFRNHQLSSWSAFQTALLQRFRAQRQHQLDLDTNVVSVAEHPHQEFTSLTSLAKETTRLLRQILALLPPAPTQNSSEATEVMNQDFVIEADQVFEEMPKPVSDETLVFDIGENDAANDSHIIDEADVFDDMFELLANDVVLDDGSALVDDVSDSVTVSLESVVQPTERYVADEAVEAHETLPNQLQRGYPFMDCKYPALTSRCDTPGVISTAMNSPDVYVVSAKFGLMLDIYEQLADFPFMLQVFDQTLACWPTTDFFQSKLFDPGISKHLLDANRLIDSRLSVDFVHNAADIIMNNAFEFNLSKAEKDKIYGIIVTQVDVYGILGYTQHQSAEKEVEKNVFAVFYSGARAESKILKICDAFGANRYSISEDLSTPFQMMTAISGRLSELNTTVAIGLAHRANLFQTIGFQFQQWNLLVKKAALESSSQIGTIFPVLQTKDSPPTYFRSNNFTSAFHEIVDAYAIAKYQAANPGVHTTIPFPFLIAVLFGDWAHGICLLATALYLIAREKKPSSQKLGDIMDMTFGGRNVIMMIAIFSIYTGLIHNEFFSVPFELFGPSAYSCRDLSCRDASTAGIIKISWEEFDLLLRHRAADFNASIRTLISHYLDALHSHDVHALLVYLEFLARTITSHAQLVQPDAAHFLLLQLTSYSIRYELILEQAHTGCCKVLKACLFQKFSLLVASSCNASIIDESMSFQPSLAGHFLAANGFTEKHYPRVLLFPQPCGQGCLEGECNVMNILWSNQQSPTKRLTQAL